MFFKKEPCYTFDDVLIEPGYSDIMSRSEIDFSQKINHVDKTFTLPVISSPMDTVTSSEMAAAMSDFGGLGVIHRYNSIEDQVKMVKDSISRGHVVVGAAVGVTADFVERAGEVFRAGAKVICVDIAHGHHKLMEVALEKIRWEIGDDVHIMAGNIATAEGLHDLVAWGADSVRVGVGGGSICETRVKTGHGVPTLHSVFACAKARDKYELDVTIIADGGIRDSGDIVKALGAGADFAMVGSILSGTDETPGEVFVTSEGKKRKVYRGMASKAAQKDWRGYYSSIEGVSSAVEYKGPVSNILFELDKGIRGGLSYSGSRTLAEFRDAASFIVQTTAGTIESSSHIKNRV